MKNDKNIKREYEKQVHNITDEYHNGIGFYLISILFPLFYQWSLEYAKCIPLQRGKDPSKKSGILGMTLNCIWWWDSCSENLRSE